MENKRQYKPNGWALIPFLVFIAVYLGAGIYCQKQGMDLAFYQVPAPVSILVGIMLAFVMFRGSVEDKFNHFVKGCGDDNIIIMCIIYILAGAFAATSKAMGGVDSTVNLGLAVIPPKFITAGIFLIACFISISIGTSVGTISALAPIAVGLAEKGGLSLPLVIGALVGGAMFGDNLSIISDTTIAATRTQNCEMKDKFRLNFKLALPSAIITFVLLLIFARPVTEPEVTIKSYNIIKILPYLFVLISALAGMNVFLVLFGGIIFSSILGVFVFHSFPIIQTATGDGLPLGLTSIIYSGFSGMFEIFLLSMLTGGLARLVFENGGIDWLLVKFKSLINGRKSAEVCISALVSLIDAATANNTVAIIIAGPVAKEISTEFKVDPRRTASLLDSFSCVMQGLIPYGAQLLIAAGIAKISPVDVIPNLWYQGILALIAIISIFIPFADSAIRKDPWNFERDLPQSKIN